MREVEERLLCRGHEQWNWFVDEGSWWAKGDKALLQGLLWRFHNELPVCVAVEVVRASSIYMDHI